MINLCDTPLKKVFEYENDLSLIKVLLKNLAHQLGHEMNAAINDGDQNHAESVAEYIIYIGHLIENLVEVKVLEKKDNEQK